MTLYKDSEKADRIQDIAFELFLDKGYEATSIRQICRAAGIEPPTLYYFFDSKKGLFFSIANKLLDKYNQMNSERMEHFKLLQPEERLYHIFLHNIKFTIGHLQDVRFFIRFTLFPPKELKQEIIAFQKEIQANKDIVVEEIMKECIEKGLFKVNLEQACTNYWKFINNNTFDVVFFNWTPSEKDLLNMWEMFAKCRLKDNH